MEQDSYFRRRGHRRGEFVDLAIGLSVLFLSPLKIHLQVAAVMWVAMVVSSLAALLLVPFFYRGGKEASRKPAS